MFRVRLGPDVFHEDLMLNADTSAAQCLHIDIGMLCWNYLCLLACVVFSPCYAAVRPTVL